MSVLEALKENHPYEEVAYEIVRTENVHQNIGMGMIGELSSEMKKMISCHKENHEQMSSTFLQMINKKIKKVAVLGGSGSFAISNAKKAISLRLCKCRF